MHAGKPNGDHDFTWVMEANTLHPSLAARKPESVDEEQRPTVALGGNLLLTLVVLAIVVAVLQFCSFPLQAG